MFIYQIRRRTGCLRPQEADDFFADDPRTVAMTVETGFRHGFQFFRMRQEAGCDRYQVFLLLDPAAQPLDCIYVALASSWPGMGLYRTIGTWTAAASVQVRAPGFVTSSDARHMSWGIWLV